jgi:triphosphoribosyl-dephospho-CoA synthetase
MTRVFKTRHYNKSVTYSDDTALCRAVKEMCAGLIAADLPSRTEAQLKTSVAENKLIETCHDSDS